MTLASTVLALCLLAPKAEGPGAFPVDLLARGDAAWEARGDPARLDQALDAYRALAAREPGNAAIELRLARAQAFRALARPAQAAEAWGLASRAAERALRTLSPGWAALVDAGDPVGAAARVEATSAEALYWLALAAWSGAQAKGVAAILAVKDVALASMDRAAELLGALDCGGPERALGSWRAALPAAVGGGAERSRAHFQKALSLGPQCQLNRVRQAETLFVLLQDRKEFERTLTEVLASGNSGPRWEPENALARKMAADLLAREDRLF